MSSIQRFLSLGFLSLVVNFGVLAQTTTGALTGNVTSDGIALPGATITISSPNLQGTRIAVSDTNGNYNFGSLPPGDYTVKVELSEMQTVVSATRVGLATTARVDADLKLSAVAEAITVTAGAEPVMESAQVATNVPATLVEELPIARTVMATATLAPGVNTNTVAPNQLQISGSPGYDNLIMVNGVSLQEVLRGQAAALFIEDAIQETTVVTGAISAEYGRFTGGVVNSITKSGGNEFSGSFRDSLTNASWSANRPRENITTDEINPVYEGTFGGYILRDRLWFFFAGRDETRDSDLLTSRTNIPYSQHANNTRYEYKLTGAITPKHNVVGSYLDYKATQNNPSFGQFYDLASLGPLDRTDPMKLISGHYNGILASNFFAEAHYAERNWENSGSGGLKTDDVATGAWGLDPQTRRYFNAPYFCADCDVEIRSSDSYTLKGTYYLATSATGTHSLVVGYDDFSEHRHANDFFSGAGWAFHTAGVVSAGATPIVSPNGLVYPIIHPGSAAMEWMPIVELSTDESDFNTRSLYVNDRWDFSNHFTLNVGVRYDKAHAQDASGHVASEDSAISPRLTAIYDVVGNGRHRITAAYNRYVSKVGGLAAMATETAGRNSSIYFLYGGPPINYENGAAVANLDSQAAFAQVWNWFQAQGGTSNPDLLGPATIPGYDYRFTKSLSAPYVDEFVLGYGMQITATLYAKADYLKRDWKEFYAYFLDQSAPQQEDQLGNVHDVATVGNSNDVERRYDALQFQLGWRPTRFNVGVDYTYATLEGNDPQEDAVSGILSTGLAGTPADFRYCELLCYVNRSPTGYLPGDQRHRVRAWLAYDLPTPRWLGGLNVSLLQSFDSGLPYSAIGRVDPNTYAAGELDNYTYAYSSLSPSGYPYYLSKRGVYRTNDITSTDVALNYERGLTKRLDFFAQAELLNVFNEQGVIAVDTSVSTNINDRSLEVFDPRTETPIEGVHWRKGPGFGRPTGPASYQPARLYRFSLGFRF